MLASNRIGGLSTESSGILVPLLLSGVSIWLFFGKKVFFKVIYVLNRLQLLLLAACEMENQLSFLGFIADFIYGVHLDGILILERAV